MAGTFRIAEVDGVEEEDALKEMQLACLPPDVLYPTDSGHWWIATTEGDKPVAFAGLKVLTGAIGYLCRAGVLRKFRGNGLQARLIRVRAVAAKRLGCKVLITDTNRNPASANSLIRCGFRLYEPEYRWALPTSIYWRKPLI